MAKTFKLFCYGTLKKGYSAFHGDALIGDVVPASLANAKMLNLGWFPGVIEGAESDSVHGEVHEYPFELMAQLDAYEGHPDLFRRILVNVNDEDVYMYRYNHHPKDEYPIVEDGVWS